MRYICSDMISVICLTDRTKEEFLKEWKPVFDYASTLEKRGLEEALKKYVASTGWPGIDKTIKLNAPYDEEENYFIDEDNNKIPMIWKLDIPEGIFYFSWGYAVCPSGIVLTFNI